LKVKLLELSEVNGLSLSLNVCRLVQLSLVKSINWIQLTAKYSYTVIV